MQDLFKLSERLIHLREYREELKNATENNNEMIDEIEAMMVELMVDEEVQNFNKDGKTFYLKSRLFASIPSEHKDDVIDWFKGHEEYSGMVKEQINANTLSAWVKERREEEDMPKEIESKLNVYEKTNIGIRSN